MLSVNPLLGGNVQIKYQSIIKTQQSAADADIAKPISKPIVANVDAAKPSAAKPAPAIDAFAAAPRVDSKNLLDGSFKDMFSNFDTDNNGLITKEEMISVLKANGAGDKDVEAVLNNVFSATSDTNDDGVFSRAEFNRRLKTDAFSAYDLNSDGKIGTEELEDAISRFKASGLKIDEENVRRIYGQSDLDENKVLTRIEFDNFNKYGRPTEETRALEVIFNQFDANADGKVTRDEALSILKTGGADDATAEAFLANVFASDLDGDGAITVDELRSRVFSTKGKTFELLDKNYDNQVTREEMDKVVAEYVKNGAKIDVNALSKAFADADTDKDGILTRAEFAAFNSRGSDADAVAAAKPEPLVTAAKPLPQEPSSDVASVDIGPLKPKIQPIMPAALDAQLFLTLQEDKA